MQKILEKYPWVSYSIDLSKIPFSFWFYLGQCVSKCDHIKHIPLLPEIRQDLHIFYLAKGVAATTAIEGNTLGEEKALDIIKGQADIEESKKYQEKEIENIIEACNKIAQSIHNGEALKISVEMLCDFNKIILSGDIPIAEGAVPGEIRKHRIGVGNYKGPDPQDVHFLLDKFCDWIEGLGAEVETEKSMGEESLAIIKAITAHLYIAWIHPFGDGNGRLARLVEFLILLKSGIPSIAAHLLSNHYNSTRVLYYANLREAKNRGPSAFFTYAIKGFQDGLKTVIKTLIEQIIFISWQQYIYEKFREMPSSASAKRQRDVLIEISKEHYKKKEPLTFDEIADVVSKIYVQYHKTSKSFTRDFRLLTEKNFIERRDKGFIPKLEPVISRLPFSI